MKTADRDFTLDELCKLSDLPRRTVRYYIQVGLVDRPQGAGRGAYYTTRHLEQLLEIRKWQDAGLSLERIRDLLATDGEGGDAVPPVRPRRPGTIEVWSHLTIDDGVELTVEPGRAGLSPEALRSFVKEVMELYRRTREEKE
ncbi:MAG: MerR family transcriptional regulator [Gammaproteobacteria bacterium]|nr:MerR family transcriptional regulator [Gammaproteobacteria bacterium]